MKKILFLGLASSLTFLYSCKNDIIPNAPYKGDLKLDKYVAIGNSLTAGYADNSLTLDGQINSYPNILAQQFARVGGGAFKQPLLLDNSGYPSLKRVLGYKTSPCSEEISLAPIPFPGSVNNDNANNISANAPFNNIAVPGIRLADFAFPGYFAYNPYSKRFTSATDQAGTPLQYALATAPTFFSCWLGNNDVLGYATGGGLGNPSGLMPGDITPVANFKAIYDNLIDGLVAQGAQGILINIPDVATTPLFTTIPAFGLTLTTQEQVNALNTAYAPLGITFEVGNNAFIIEDAAAPGGRRKIKNGELILLTASDSIKCFGWGSSTPIPNKYVLNETELGHIRTATTAFNNIIKDAATRNNIAYFDANTYLASLSSGMVWNGVKLGPTFVTGGLFSLDGVHLTPKGYALVANELIKVINSQYKSNIGTVDINDYTGMIFP